MSQYLYRFRITGDAQDGDLRAIDEASDVPVHLVRVPSHKIVNGDTAPAIARKIEAETGCETFSDDDVYFVAGDVAKRSEILRLCTAYGLMRPEPIKLEEVSKGVSSAGQTPDAGRNKRVWAVLGVVGAILFVVYLCRSEQPHSDGASAVKPSADAVHAFQDKMGPSANVATTPRPVSPSPAPAPVKVAPGSADVVNGQVEQIHYGTSTITVGGQTIHLYGIGPISFADSNRLFAYWSTHTLQLKCVSQSQITYRCTYFDEKHGERDFSRIVVRFGAARAAADAPKYLKQDDRFAQKNQMGDSK